MIIFFYRSERNVLKLHSKLILIIYECLEYDSIFLLVVI